MTPKACCIAGIALEVRLGLKMLLGSSVVRIGGRGINGMDILLRGRLILTPQARKVHGESCRREVLAPHGSDMAKGESHQIFLCV